LVGLFLYVVYTGNQFLIWEYFIVFVRL
jgi:hypothetical protein